MDSIDLSVKMRRKRENFIKTVEHEVEKDAKVVGDKTGMPPWMVLSLFALLLLVIIGLLGFCIWRFFAKRRGKKDTTKVNIDEQGLVEGEEDVDVNEEDQLKVLYHFSHQGRIKSNMHHCSNQPRSTWASFSTS